LQSTTLTGITIGLQHGTATTPTFLKVDPKFSGHVTKNKDGGHTIRSVVAENPMLHANLMALCFIEPKL